MASSVIDKIWPDKTEQEKQQLAMAMTIVQGQLAVNQVEGRSTDRFVAGWRPFIGWVLFKRPSPRTRTANIYDIICLNQITYGCKSTIFIFNGK